MSAQSVRIFPIGDGASTVEFGAEISESLNSRAMSLADYFEAEPFLGFIEAVPAYASTIIFYDLLKIRSGFPNFATAFEAVNIWWKGHRWNRISARTDRNSGILHLARPSGPATGRKKLNGESLLSFFFPDSCILIAGYSNITEAL